MAPHNLQPIGKAFIVYGTVKAVSAAGIERILTPNSVIYANERIVTGTDGSISITLADNHGHLDLGRMSDVLMDEDIFGAGGHEGARDAVAQVTDVQAALQNNPNFDPTTDLPSPAAGAGVVGGGAGAAGGGRHIVVFDATNLQVTPDSGAETKGITHNFLDPPPGALTQQAVPAATEPGAGTVERTLDEANLPEGTHPNTAALNTHGTLADLGVNFGSDTSGTLDFGHGHTIVIDGDSGHAISIATAYGDLTVKGNGDWSYTLDHNAPHPNAAATGTADQISDPFPFSVSTAHGTASGDILIHINDDGPSLSGSNQAVTINVREDALNASDPTDHDLSTGSVASVGNHNDEGTIHLADVITSRYGADGPGTTLYAITGIGSAGVDSGLTSNGVKVIYFQEGNAIVAHAGTSLESQVVFTFTVNSSTGDATFNLNGQLDHIKDAGHDTTLSINLGQFVQMSVTDNDGDTVHSTFAGLITVNVADDIPVVTGKEFTGKVYEDGLPGGNSEPGHTAVTTTLDLGAYVHPGADMPVSYSLVAPATDFDTGLYSGGNKVSYLVSDDGHLLTASAAGHTVFTFMVKGTTGEFNLVDHLDHTPKSFGNPDNNTLAITNLGQFVQVVDADHDAVNFAGKIAILVENDVPVITFGEKTLTFAVQEDALPGGNIDDAAHDTVQQTLQLSDLANAAGVVKVGADTPGTISYGITGLSSTVGVDAHLQSNGTEIYYFQSGNSIVAHGGNSVGSPVIFTLGVDPGSGAATFTLSGPLDHSVHGDDAILSIPNLGQYVQLSVTDADHDTVSATFNNLLNVSVENDIPVVTGKEFTGKVYEDGLPGGNSEPGHTAVTTTLDLGAYVHPGADMPVSYSLVAPATDFDTGLYSGGNKVSYLVSDDGHLLTASAAGHTVFTFMVKGTTGEFNLVDHLDHTPKSFGNPDNNTLAITNLGQFVQVVDADHDAVNFAGKIAILVENDVPVAVNDGPYTVTEDATAHSLSGNVLSNDLVGADAPTGFTSWGASPADLAAKDFLANYGTLHLNGDGSWSFDLNNNLAAVQALQATDTITKSIDYTMHDADGDTSTAHLSITIQGTNDAPTVQIWNDSQHDGVFNSDHDNLTENVTVKIDTWENDPGTKQIFIDNSQHETQAVDISGNPPVKSILTHASDITVTFISEGAGYQNTVGWYDLTNPSVGHVIWANASQAGSGGTLNGDANPGDNSTFVIHASEVHAGTQLGFFLIPNAYSLNSNATPPDGGMVYFDQDGKAYTDPGHHNLLTSATDNNSALFSNSPNADGLQHAIAGVTTDDSHTLHFAFEDLNGGGDHDYNDVMFKVDVGSGHTVDTPKATFDVGVTITDVDSANMSQAVLSLHLGNGDTVDYDHALLPNGFGINDVVSGNNHTITITGNASIDTYNNLLDSFKIAVGHSGQGEDYTNIDPMTRHADLQVTDSSGAVSTNSHDIANFNLHLNITGSTGNDTLTGGAGADTFKASAGHDTITDYVEGEDVIDFGNLLSTKVTNDNLSITNDGGKAQLHIYADPVIHNATTEVGSVTFSDHSYSSSDTANSLLGEIHDTTGKHSV